MTDNDYLQLLEVQVLERDTGTALDDSGTASQSSTYNANTGAEKAIDGDTTSGYPSSLALTGKGFGSWWEVDLGGSFDVETIVVYNRGVAGARLEDAVVEALDFGGNVLWSDIITGTTNGSVHTFVVTTNTPTVAVAAVANGSEADGSPLQFEFTRTGDTTAALSVNYRLSGTALPGIDFTGSATGTVTFAAGASSTTLSLPVLSDNVIDPGDTVRLRIDPSPEYDITTGKMLWEHAGKSIPNISLVIGDGRIFFLKDDLNEKERAQARATTAANIASDTYVPEREQALPQDERDYRRVVCLDIKTGREIWNRSTSSSRPASSSSSSSLQCSSREARRSTWL